MDHPRLEVSACAAGARGGQNQALVRSRGGFSIKVQLRTNAEGLPVALLPTAGETHDSAVFADLMAEHDMDPERLLAQRGYDSDPIRADVCARGGTLEIPTQKSRRVQHSVNCVYSAVYPLRDKSSAALTA